MRRLPDLYLKTNALAVTICLSPPAFPFGMADLQAASSHSCQLPAASLAARPFLSGIHTVRQQHTIG